MEKIKLTDNNLNKKQPSNLEAEQALLGSILVNNDIIDEVSNTIEPTSFYDPAHTKIYEIIETLNKKGMIANPITLKNYFEKDNMLNEVGGTEYLVKLTRFSGSTKQAVDYAKIIHEMYLRRELVLISDNLSSETLDAKEKTAEKILEDTEKSLFKLAERGSFSRSFLKFSEALDQTIATATQAMRSDAGIVGVPTGLTALDEKLGGLHKSDLVILAGRPGMGKTALATNIAFHAAQNIMSRQEKSSIAFFSLEMSSEQLSTRILSEQARIKSDDIRKGKITEEEINRYIETSRNIYSLPLFIDETPAITIATLSNRARRIKRLFGVSLIVVDYIQLMRGASSSNRNDNRVQEVSEITQGLKALAKELKVPVLALSQLSRAVEQRDEKKPQLSDLRESGSIEQDADVVMFVYREAYYLENKQPKLGSIEHAEWQSKMNDVNGLADIILGKQRHGPTGVVKVEFEGIYTKFKDLSNN